jgi:hypothetical protein
VILCAASLAIVPVAAEAATGDLDDTFSGDGLPRTDFFGEDDGGGDPALQPDGKIVVAGFTEAGPALQPDGKIVAAGSAGSGPSSTDFGIASYLGG